MKVSDEKYLVITETDTIDAKCSDCAKAHIDLYSYVNLTSCIRRLAQISQIADVNVIGVFKKIDKYTIDKDLNVIEEE